MGADGEAPLSAREADLRGPVAIVVGSEGRGLGPAIRRRCDLLVRIPMHGKIESLNAAVAGSILLYEAAAQRRLPDTGPRTSSHDEPEPDAIEVASAQTDVVPEAWAEELPAEASAEALSAQAPTEPATAGPEDAQATAQPELEEPQPEAVAAEAAEAPTAKPRATRARKPRAEPVAAGEVGTPASAVAPKVARTRKPVGPATPTAPADDDDALLPEHPAAESPEV